MPTVKQLVGKSGSHHPRYHASKPPTPKLLKFPTSLNCASARERALEGAREDRAEATRMSRATLTTQATERFVRARPERRMPTARMSVSVRAFSFLSFSSSRKCPVVQKSSRPNQISRRAISPFAWTTSSSTSRMTSTRRMWGNRSRRRRRCPTARGKTTDRYAGDTPPPESGRAHSIADRHRINPKRRRGRSSREGRRANERTTPRSERRPRAFSRSRTRTSHSLT